MLQTFRAEFSIENNEILRVSLSIEKNHKDVRVGGAVYNRIKQDGLISWVLWRWDNHRAVTLCKLSSKYSCEVNVFVSICITWWVGWLGRVRGITCKVYTTAKPCSYRTRGYIIVYNNTDQMSVWIRVQPTGNRSKYYRQQNTMQDTVGQAWLRRKWGIKNLLSIREVPLVVARSPECSCDSTSRIGTSLAASIWHRLSCQCNFSVVIFCALLLAFARLTHRSPINAFLMSNTPWHHWIQDPLSHSVRYFWLPECTSDHGIT